MKRKISLVLAIIMIVTTVISAMPAMTLTAFAQTKAEGATVLTTADGTVYDGKSNVTFADAVAAVKAATTENLTIKLNKDITMTSVTSFSGNRTVTIDGNGHTITTNLSNAFDTSKEVEGTSWVFKNITILHNITNATKDANGITNAGVTIRTRAANGAVSIYDSLIVSNPKWATINVFGNEANNDKNMGLYLENVDIIDFSNYADGNDNHHKGAIALGNGNSSTNDKKTVSIDIKNCNIYASKAIEVSKYVSFSKFSISDSRIYTFSKDSIYIRDGASINVTPAINNVKYNAPNGYDFGIEGATKTDFAIDVKTADDLYRAVTFASNLPATSAAFKINVLNDITAYNFVFTNKCPVILTSKDADNICKLTLSKGGTAPNNNIIRINGSGAVTFENINFNINAKDGCAVQFNDDKANLTLKSVNFHTTEAKWNAINLLSRTGTADLALTVEDSIVTCANKPVIVTGNPNDDLDNKTATITIKNSHVQSMGGDAIQANKKSTTTIDVKSSVILGTDNAIQVEKKESVVKADNKSVLAGPSKHINNTAEASVTYTASKFAKIGDTAYDNWSAIKDAANAAAADVEIILTADAYIPASVGFNNANAKIIINGDGHTIYGAANNSINPKTDFELKNANVDSTFGTFLKVGGVGDAFAGIDVDINNVDFYAHGALASQWCVINAVGYENGAAPEAASRNAVNLHLNDVHIVQDNVHSQSSTGAIRFGNGKENVNLTMINSSIDTTGTIYKNGIYTGASVGTIKLINTTINTVEAKKAIECNANVKVEVFNSELTGGVNGSTADNVVAKPEMDKGASVRINTGSNGIRFTATISAETIENIMKIADEGSVKYGTLVTVKEAVDANGGIFDAEAIRALSWKVMDIKGVIDNGVTVNAPAEGKTYGDVNIRAAIVNIKDSHIKTEYAAIAYVEYTVNGITCYAYSEYDAANTRSMYAIAQAALADVGPQSSTYVYPMGDGTYSPYTTAQRDVLQSYIAKGDALAG